MCSASGHGHSDCVSARRARAFSTWRSRSRTCCTSVSWRWTRRSSCPSATSRTGGNTALNTSGLPNVPAKTLQNAMFPRATVSARKPAAPQQEARNRAATSSWYCLERAVQIGRKGCIAFLPSLHAEPALGTEQPECRLVGRRNGKDPAKDSKANPMDGRRVTTVTGEVVCVRRAPDLDALRKELQARRAAVLLPISHCSSVSCQITSRASSG